MSEELKTSVETYLSNAKPLFSGLKAVKPASLDGALKLAEEAKTMALAYYEDALHFQEKGEYARALAALEYAEGWLDAGVRLGYLKTTSKRDGVL
ncbi:Uncharacterised protein [uncultured archaeon]|nr:Uncharacterised protein [uncultured archaeon]